MVIPMSGFELRAKFFPLVPMLAQLAEEAKEGVDYPFTVQEMLVLNRRDYNQLCRNLDRKYGFEPMLPEEGYDPVYGSFACALVAPANGQDGILMTKYANQIFAAYLPDCALLDLADVPQQRISLYLPTHPRREAER